MPNGIELILADHQRLGALFDEFGETSQAGLVGRVIDALKAHDEAELAALYPMAAAVLDDADLIGRSLAAHTSVKTQIDLVTTVEGASLVEAFQQLQLLVEEHVEDEERELLPRLAELAPPQLLDELAARIMQAKQRVG